MQAPTQQTIPLVMKILRGTCPRHSTHEAFQHDPFQMLVAVVLSQRATDAMTIPVAKKLFEKASTPQDIVDLPMQHLEQIIRPIGFFHAKALALKKLSTMIIKRFDGKVPSTEQELLSLPQVGRKTANIMLTMFFHTPKIAVDVHVHRIANRLGWIKTKTPEKTEAALTKLIPKKYIPIVNQVFVQHGQKICRPINPKCSICPVRQYCQQIGVTRSR